ncbi:hypothetical protein [Cupriavidus basilensis]|uniref:hypothetical protein n=1 Tax=Cupriavidus basilensis TaxID=68895 RepID=UPI00157A512D|nr:hypothetical protein [Cupriavidus basilensis]NUA27793.1 hypothetical protein [Cupriavidus basilensis]
MGEFSASYHMQNEARTNKFFADAWLPQAEFAELEAYKVSGYDRGTGGISPMPLPWLASLKVNQVCSDRAATSQLSPPLPT